MAVFDYKTVNREIDEFRKNFTKGRYLTIWDRNGSKKEFFFLCLSEPAGCDDLNLHVREGNEMGEIIIITLKKKSLVIQGNTILDDEHTCIFK